MPAPDPRGCILLVEDDPLVAEVIIEILTLEGHAVDLASNGVIALQKIESTTYDLVVSDLQMPELDGPGLYRELERRQPMLARRVIFISGTTGLPEYEAFLQQTRAPVLTKPFSLRALGGLVARLLSAGPVDTGPGQGPD